MKIVFSENLRLAAIKEVRELYQKQTQLEREEDEKEREMADLRKEIAIIKDQIKASCSAFGFELRGVRDSEGHLIPNEEGGYKRNYFFEEEDAPE